MPESKQEHARAPIVVIAGPTAAGKSALAIALAERWGSEILNADSMQVYRYLDIGTGKPSLVERARVPHHLLDVVTPDVLYDAAQYARAARRIADERLAAGKSLFLTGGTGLYIRAFLGGLVSAGGADPEFRERLEREHARAVENGDPERLHRRLLELDREAAWRIHPHDVRRIIRALEIQDREAERSSELRSAHAFSDQPYRALYLVLDPGLEDLDKRIDARCHDMIERGLLREVRHLYTRGYGPGLRPLQAIGYRHMQAVVEGRDTLANALLAMQHDTRRFARRQRTWFRAVRGAHWFRPDESRSIEEIIAHFLNTSRD